MSTKLTTNNPNVETIDMPLGQLMLHAQQSIFQNLLQLMTHRGHTNLTITHLIFIANLDCGITHAALVSRRMRVTRQAVFRTTRELQQLGVLSLEEDSKLRNQKIIKMTPLGNTVATDARECLAKIEAGIATHIGNSNFNLLKTILSSEWPIAN